MEGQINIHMQWTLQLQPVWTYCQHSAHVAEHHSIAKHGGKTAPHFCLVVGQRLGQVSLSEESANHTFVSESDVNSWICCSAVQVTG